MKRCPKCKREYDDDLRFCLEDGTPLTRDGITPTIAAPTAVLPVSNDQANTMSSAGRPDVPIPGAGVERDLASRTYANTAEPSGSPLTARIVGSVLLLLIVIANVAGMIFWSWLVVRRLPLTLAFMVVILLAMVRAPRHPKVSLLAITALGFDLLETFVYIILSRALPANFYYALAVLDSCAAAAVIVMLTLAVVSERFPQPMVN